MYNKKVSFLIINDIFVKGKGFLSTHTIS